MPPVRWTLLACSAAALLSACGFMLGGKAGMGFFVTGTNPGKGGHLGGLAGATSVPEPTGLALAALALSALVVRRRAF